MSTLSMQPQDISAIATRVRNGEKILPDEFMIIVAAVEMIPQSYIVQQGIGSIVTFTRLIASRIQNAAPVSKGTDANTLFNFASEFDRYIRSLYPKPLVEGQYVDKMGKPVTVYHIPGQATDYSQVEGVVLNGSIRWLRDMSTEPELKHPDTWHVQKPGTHLVGGEGAGRLYLEFDDGEFIHTLTMGQADLQLDAVYRDSDVMTIRGQLGQYAKVEK